MDFVAVSLVSCIAMIAGFAGVFEIKSWIFGRAVFSDEAFHVIKCVLWLVVGICGSCGGGRRGVGGGWEYSGNGLLSFSASVRRFLGRNGNFSEMVCKSGGILFCRMYSYSWL